MSTSRSRAGDWGPGRREVCFSDAVFCHVRVLSIPESKGLLLLLFYQEYTCSGTEADRVYRELLQTSLCGLQKNLGPKFERTQLSDPSSLPDCSFCICKMDTPREKKSDPYNTYGSNVNIKSSTSWPALPRGAKEASCWLFSLIISNSIKEDIFLTAL